MYTGDHIVLSTGLGLLLAKRLRLAPVPLIAILIGINLIDLDHLVFYRLDDGTANSLTLHPLHIYAGVIVFLLILLPLISRVRIAVAYALAGGVSLHLAADALAYAFDYDVATLVALGVLGLLGFAALARAVVVPRLAAPVTLFAAAAWLLCYASQGIIHYGLHLDPRLSRVPWIVPQLWTLILAVAFWAIFARLEGPLLAPGGRRGGVDLAGTLAPSADPPPPRSHHR